MHYFLCKILYEYGAQIRSRSSVNSCPDDHDGFVYIAQEFIVADGKKGGGHVATPHPSKKAATKQQTPKSGAFPCNSCNRYFCLFTFYLAPI